MPIMDKIKGWFRIGGAPDASDVIMAAIKEQLAHEAQHPVTYADDQRIRACIQRLTMQGVKPTPQIAEKIETVMREQRATDQS